MEISETYKKEVDKLDRPKLSALILKSKSRLSEIERSRNRYDMETFHQITSQIRAGIQYSESRLLAYDQMLNH